MTARALLLAMLMAPTGCLAGNAPGAGVYDLRICGTSCASGSPIAQGTLILLASPVRDASGAPLVVGNPQPVNGCYRLERYGSHGMIGNQPGGYVLWSRTASKHVLVNFNPDGVDAFYIVDFRVSAGDMSGIGMSGYASEPAPPPLPPDRAFAHRTGAADPARCAPAVIEPLRRPICAPPALCR